MQDTRKFKVNNFDLLRLLAATQVIVDHYFQHSDLSISGLGHKILYLFPGVPVFFVISGYLISASYERNASFRGYLYNRALRIFPGLWACIFITILVISLTGVSFFNKNAIFWFPSQLAGMIYTPGFLSNYGFGSYNGSLWSIPIELQFYLLLPLIYTLIPQKRIDYGFFGIFLLFLFLHILFYIVKFPSPLFRKAAGYTFIPYFYLFLIGVIFQRLQIFKTRFIYNKAHFWVIGYVAYSLCFPDGTDHLFFATIKHIILSFCVISLAYTAPGIAQKLLRNNDISYGIYIYHGLLLTVIVQEKLYSYTNVFELVALTYVLALLSWIFVEKPFIKSKRQTIKTPI
ncbi:acyltransferase [Mucilaginibacter sabulilitoris]|uniref:Acyltransferase n=1 Tax=Mucilaginibacter sabulilitoris TaxID=1173583 RepID=A0ABZ0TU45_9SPHI|nr:acyltransferase [Mucilaginibacter sabulilitoris]WPU95678.1 acyltransferase [Mucilaginibacter sabulilitoris]